MNRDKQIEEMAKDLGIAFQLAGTTRFGAVAEVLVNAGYRKASDVAREIFEEIEKETEIGRIMNACAIVSLDALAELKKEYTESEKEK
jgi:hypothetical protein